MEWKQRSPFLFERLTKRQHICYTICMDRTVRVLIQSNSEQEQALLDTLSQFTQAFNRVCAYGWSHHEKNGVRLHHETYYVLREAYPSLNSNVLIQARMKATEALKSAFTWQDKKEKAYPNKVAKALKLGKPVPVFKPVKCPESALCPVRYNERTYALDWSKQTVTLVTTHGRLTLPFTVPQFSAMYAGHPVKTADLIHRKGRWWLHVVVDVPTPDVPKSDEVIGIDLGLNRPAVTSKCQFLGERHWKEVDRRHFRIKRKLQSNGSKSAKRHLKKLSQKQARFHRDCDHVLSKRIVQNAPQGSTLVLENLTHIRDTSKMGRGKDNKNVENKRRLHSWTYAQLCDFLTYKGQERGITVVKIDPRHTSQTCSRCGHQARNNRRSQSLFLCRKCGYCLNADLNASYNIRSKYLVSLDTLLTDGLPSTNLSSQASVQGQAPAFKHGVVDI